MAAGDAAGAAEQLIQLRNGFREPAIATVLADALLQLGKPVKDALAVLQVDINAGIDNHWTHYAHGHHLAKLGLVDEAAAAFRCCHASQGWQQSQARGYTFTHDYFSAHIANWQCWFDEQITQAPIRILEIGSWQGGSTLWLLDQVIGPRGGSITCVGTWEASSEHTLLASLNQSSEALFDANLARNDLAEHVIKRKGTSADILPSLEPASFDLIYIDGAHEASFAIQDAINSHNLIAPGGFLLFGDLNHSYADRPEQNITHAIDFFLNCFSKNYTEIHRDSQLLLRRDAPGPLAAHTLDTPNFCSAALSPEPPSQPFSLQELDAWLNHFSLRRYQLLIFDQTLFDLEIDYIFYSFVRCRTSPDNNKLELKRHGDGAPFELISEGFGSGFRLGQAQLQPLAVSIATADLPSGAPVLRSGDSNFAHFLWNELDPLLYLAQRAAIQGCRLSVVQDFDTILNLASLPGVDRLPSEVLTHRPSVHAGAMWVSAAARSTALVALGAPVAPCRGSGAAPLVVLGVRGPGRRELRNEEELLIGLIHLLHRRWPQLQIALDGFTYQHNIHQDPGSLSRYQAIAERVARIQSACPKAAVESLCGLSFEAYLQRVAVASAYITQEGTMQHKIGWFYPEIPGICLVACPHSQAIAHWHLGQREGATKLIVLPIGLLVHVDTSTGTNPRNQPYEAPEPILTIDIIEQLLRRLLAQGNRENVDRKSLIQGKFTDGPNPY